MGNPEDTDSPPSFESSQRTECSHSSPLRTSTHPMFKDYTEIYPILPHKTTYFLRSFPHLLTWPSGPYPRLMHLRSVGAKVVGINYTHKGDKACSRQTQRSPGSACETGFWMYSKRWDHKLNKEEFIDLETPSLNIGLDILTKKGDDTNTNLLLGFLLETWKKSWPRVSEIEVPELLWQMLNEGIKRLWDLGLLE